MVPEWMWNLSIVMTYVPVALGCVIWWGWRGAEAEIWLQIVGYFPLRDLLLGTAVGAGLAVGTRLFAARLAFGRRMVGALAALVGPLTLPTCTAVALASSVGEEFLFRGVIQPELGLLWTSVLFAVVHVPVEAALRPWPFFAFGMGLLLGGLYQWTGSLPAPIAVHFTLNWLNLIWLSRLARQS